MAGHKDLNDFISHVRTVGLPTASHFQILLPNLDGSSENISLLCDDLVIPGVSFMTTELRTMGEVVERVYGVTYASANFTFLLDNKFDARKYFETWSALVYNRANRTAGFYDKYVKDINIESIDKAGKSIYSITLFEAYPKSMADISLSSSSHEVLKLSVTMNYKYWTSDKIVEKEKKEVESMFGFDGPADNTIAKALKEKLGGMFGFDGPADNTIETIKKAIPESMFGFDKADNTLAKFGPAMGTDLARSCKAVENNASGFSGIPSFGSAMSGIGTTINSVGAAIGNIGKTVTAVTAPLAAVAGTVNSLSNSIGALDSVLKAVGIKNPGLSSINKDLRKLSGDMGKVAKLNGVPGKLGSLGGSMNALGGSFKQIQKSFDAFPSASKKLKDSIGTLGDKFASKGNETNAVANTMNTKLDNGTYNV